MFCQTDSASASLSRWYRECGSIWPCHPAHAWSRLISEAKQDRAWLVLGWDDVADAVDCLQQTPLFKKIFLADRFSAGFSTVSLQKPCCFPVQANLVDVKYIPFVGDGFRNGHTTQFWPM